MSDDNIRKTLQKNFSADYPFSQFTSIQFNVDIQPRATAITKSYFGFWEEKIYAKFGEEAHK